MDYTPNVRPRFTIDERRVAGKERRSSVPRVSHGDWTPAFNRPDPVAVLKAEEPGILQDLIPIKYGRMLDSAFAFYRGSAAVMAGDLAKTPVSGIRVQLAGDAHLSNFGAYGTPERRLVFDLNDFDETLPGPWEWDIKRLVASLVVAGRVHGLNEANARRPRPQRPGPTE